MVKKLLRIEVKDRKSNLLLTEKHQAIVRVINRWLISHDSCVITTLYNVCQNELGKSRIAYQDVMLCVLMMVLTKDVRLICNNGYKIIKKCKKKA